ncbi:MAG: thiopurine S-methyltransferase [Alcanivorax sp.]|uniref:thiopurine S-methyltransferase n=1 Tax=Alcanivorax sp. TaxID=1872427 RepID=UPI003DA74F8E
MNPEFWHQKWHNSELGFHLSQVHPLLQRYLGELSLKAGHTVFLPLCGKTLDIGYLLEQGYRVIGAELSEKAVTDLFASLNRQPATTPWQGGIRYQHGDLTVFQGDIFLLQAEDIEATDALYDRAALIALPDTMRERYARHLMALTDKAPQLLITLEYDQQQMDGPPFSVGKKQVKNLYESHYRIAPLSRKMILDHEPLFRERGLTAIYENVFLLT